MALLVALLAAWILGCGVVVALGHLVRVTHRGRPLRLSAEAVACWARESATHALLLPMRPMGWLPTARPGAGRAHPVLLVPGYLMNRSCWHFLATWLRGRGWDRVYAMDNRPFNGRVELFAEQLEREVQALCASTGSETVDLVAHSMGGVIAAHWILHHGGASRVRRLVTLGSPLGGTRMAVFALLREGQDLYPQAPVILGLDRLPVEAIHLWSEQDHLVIPSENATPPWAGRSRRLPWMGHLEMLTNLRAFRAVGEALREPWPTEGEE